MVKRDVAKVIYSIGFNIDNDKEDFYREQLMLYLPWRKCSDILGGYLTYEDRYTDHKMDRRQKETVCV
jgi:hypothetical protein